MSTRCTGAAGGFHSAAMVPRVLTDRGRWGNPLTPNPLSHAGRGGAIGTPHPTLPSPKLGEGLGVRGPAARAGLAGNSLEDGSNGGACAHSLSLTKGNVRRERVREVGQGQRLQPDAAGSGQGGQKDGIRTE